MKPQSGWFKTQDNPSKLGTLQWDSLKCKCDILLGKLTRHVCRLSLLLQSHSKSHLFSLFSSNAMTIDSHQEPASNKYQIKPLSYPEVTYALNYLLFILHRILLLWSPHNRMRLGCQPLSSIPLTPISCMLPQKNEQKVSDSWLWSKNLNFIMQFPKWRWLIMFCSWTTLRDLLKFLLYYFKKHWKNALTFH